ncbi:nucleotidyltransferase domain-containing protein [Candidatus Pacearchaeota archaeon]|nr:nucleotidyltransferase domain-containing protein [Candidatus Pacearchaeota archaeon]
MKSKILTKKAIEIINKRLENKRMSQQDSNYLSRFVRPKLRDMTQFNAKVLLRKLEYNPKAIFIERKIRDIILRNVPQVDTIIICGSAIQSNYKEYNDIDLIIATKKILTPSLKKKKELIEKLKIIGKKENLNLDVQIYSKKSIILQYPGNPSLIYQLKDSRIIYGKIKIPNKISVNHLELKMKLDWSEDFNTNSKPKEIYNAIRNALLVSLLMNKKIDNYYLSQNLINILGDNLVFKLKNNTASLLEKKLALNYLNLLVRYLEIELNKSIWEKIEIENL